MSQVTITANAVYPPKPGKKMSNIKCGDAYYLFDAAKFSFAQGQTYTIEFTSSDFNNRTYHTVSKIVSGAQAAPAGGSNAPRANDASWTPEKVQGHRRLEIAKACIQGNVSSEIAAKWLNWVNAADEQGPPE